MDAMATSAPTVYVEPDRTGRWIVRRAGDEEFLSRHETANDADRAARALVREDTTLRVLLKDRYQRVRHG
jgi:hypothetical protein